MNASQNLRMAFWALIVSLGLLSLLLVGLRPEAAETVSFLMCSISGSDVGESRFDGAVTDAPVTAQPDTGQRFQALTIDRWEQPSEKSLDRSFQSAAVTQRVSGSHPAAIDSARSPWIQLEMIVDDEPAPVSDASQQSTVSVNRKLNAQLTSLQSAIERLQQTESDRRADELGRAAQQLQQTQQSQRLQALELQLQRLQSSAAATPKNTQSAAVPRPSDAATDPVPDRFSLRIQHAKITDVLEVLGETTDYNILIGEGVGGTVPSANLRDVTIAEALESILHSLDLAFEQDGNFIRVITKSEQTARKLNAAKMSAERDGPDAR